MKTPARGLGAFLIKHPPSRLFGRARPPAEATWRRLLELDSWTFAQSEALDWTAIEELQVARLGRLLEFAAKHTPHWTPHLRGRETRSDPLAVLKSLPILTREHLSSADLTPFLSSGIDPWRRELLTTSGTTTTPGRFYADRLSFLRMEAHLKHIFGLRDTGRLLRINLFFPPFRPLGNHFSSSFAEDSSVTAKNALEAMRKFETTHLFGVTTTIVRTAAVFAAQKATHPLHLIATVGEHLTDEDRHLVENVFGCPVLTIYACREAAGPMAYECAQRNGWHINGASFLVEVLNEKQREAQSGEEGDIVVTMFENEVMPFIRYRLGDRGRIDFGACPCGRRSPRLFFTGRRAQLVALKNGNSTPLLAVVDLIRQHTPLVTQFQFEQSRPGEILCRVVAAEGFTNDHLKQISEAAEGRFQGQLRISVELGKTLPGKNILFINKLTPPASSR